MIFQIESVPSGISIPARPHPPNFFHSSTVCRVSHPFRVITHRGPTTPFTLYLQLHPARLRLDLETRTIVDSTPDVAFCPIAPSDERLLVVLASDGLWQYLRTPDDSELCSVLQNFYPAVLAEMGADVRALAAKHNINLAAADDEQRAALIAELEENPKSVRRLMLALHRVVNELNTYVLMPQRSSNLVRDDFSVLCMDVQILRGTQRRRVEFAVVGRNNAKCMRQIPVLSFFIASLNLRPATRAQHTAQGCGGGRRVHCRRRDTRGAERIAAAAGVGHDDGAPRGRRCRLGLGLVMRGDELVCSC